jgi:hypothetical protein
MPGDCDAELSTRVVTPTAGSNGNGSCDYESVARGRRAKDGTATGFRERLRRLFHWDSCVDRLGRAAPGAKNRRNNGPLKSIEDAREGA